jgi:hypothetical protein
VTWSRSGDFIVNLFLFVGMWLHRVQHDRGGRRGHEVGRQGAAGQTADIGLDQLTASSSFKICK